jgi:hypothetical protein
VLHVPAMLLRRAPAGQEAAAGDEPRPGLRWGMLLKLLAGGLVLGGLLGMAARAGMIGGILRAGSYAVLGAGAAYYVSFLLPKRLPDGSLTQVWGLVGAGIGIAIGTARWMGILGGLALAGGALAWASRRTVTASPTGTDELSAQGYLPFGVGLSIAAALLAFTGGLDRVREVFVEIAPGLGL